MEASANALWVKLLEVSKHSKISSVSRAHEHRESFRNNIVKITRDQNKLGPRGCRNYLKFYFKCARKALEGQL